MLAAAWDRGRSGLRASLYLRAAAAGWPGQQKRRVAGSAEAQDSGPVRPKGQIDGIRLPVALLFHGFDDLRL